MADSLLSVRGVSVRYGAIEALRDASLDVRSGEIVGVVGANGAGKSTLLRAIVGAEPPAGGSIELGDRPIAGLRPEAVVTLGVALVPEGRRTFQTLTTLENLRVPVSRGTADAATGRWDVDRVLELFPRLAERANTLAGHLSGGEQQMLAIGRALLTNPRLLLVDEPSLGLAPIVVDNVFALLERLRADGASILLVEQNAVRTAAVSDRLYVLRSGVIEEVEKDATLDAAIASGELYFGVPAA